MRHLRLKPLLRSGDICHVAISQIADSDPPGLHSHDFLEIFLILEGEGWHFINGKKISLGKGDFVFIRAPDRHGFLACPGVRMRLLNVAFLSSWFRHFRFLLPRQAARWMQGAMPPTIRLPAGAREALERRGLDLLLDEAPRHRELAQFCLEAFGFLERRRKKNIFAPDWLALSVAAMDEPENLRKTIAYFQRRAGRSPEHFARLCRLHFGVSPTELLNQARIRGAKRKLLESDAKVIDIGYDCGFENLGYFHRTFLRLSGFTPRHWRLKNSALTVPR
jgi:AraC-like DNA-binding protein